MKTQTSPYSGGSSSRNALLLLRQKCPLLVQFAEVHGKVTHHRVVQAGAALADPDAEIHDRLAVHVGQPLGGADGASLRQRGDHLDLLLVGELIHRALPSSEEKPTIRVADAGWVSCSVLWAPSPGATGGGAVFSVSLTMVYLYPCCIHLSSPSIP